jgi:hypothetical protein
MARHKPFAYHAVKAVRISGWFLLVLMVLYVISGYALVGELGFDRLMSVPLAEGLHLHWRLDVPLVLGLAVHVGAAAYLAMRRWGWIGPKRKT